MPLQRRLPKRGFRSMNQQVYQVVNLEDLKKCDPKVPITPEVLAAQGLVKTARLPVKVLGGGMVDRAYVVKAQAFSKKARESIGASGGQAEEIPL